MSKITRRQAITGGAAAGITAALPAAISTQAEGTQLADDELTTLLHEHWAARGEVIAAGARAQESLRRSPVVGYDQTGTRPVGYFEWSLAGMSEISDNEADIRNRNRAAAYESLRAAQQRLANLEKKLTKWRSA